MTKWNHAFDFCFEVITDHEDSDEVPASLIRAHLIERATRLSDEEILEACSCIDSMEARDPS
jgi:hypothetical protein